MTTIADLLDAGQLSQMVDLAVHADVPVEAVMPDPVRLVDAVCRCGAKLKIAEPIVGEPCCRDCAKERLRGRGGRRYVKTHFPVRTEAAPHELAQAAGVDLSKMSDAEIGTAVRKAVLGMSVARMTEARRMTNDQLRKVVALIEHPGLSRDQAVAFVLKRS